MGTTAVDESEHVVWANSHRLRFVPPDLLCIQWNGRCSRADVEAVFAKSDQWLEQRKHFVVADFTNMKTADPDARKFMANHPRVHQVMGLALWGATFHIRVVLDLLVRAVEVLQRGKHGTIRFFETESEAMAWVSKERERLKMQPPAH